MPSEPEGWEKTREAAERLSRRLQLPIPPVPEEKLPFPENVADLSNEELPHHLAYWTALGAYAGYQAALVDSAHGNAEAEYEMEYDLRYATRDDKHVTDKRHISGASKAVRKLRREMILLERDLNILRALLEGYEKKYAAVSRELSRRGIERSMNERR